MSAVVDPASAIAIVRRADLPTLSSVVVDGHVHTLGVHKDFRKHPALAAAIPDKARLSLAWVRLEEGEQLAVHEHPVTTMIVVCDGRGTLLGDRVEAIEPGDVVAIPPGCRHGFVGGPGGYWALSVQFDGDGLYERPDQARVQFVERSAGYDELMRRNHDFARKHVDNPMFDLVRGGALADPERRARYLDAVQVWSNAFHRLLCLRAATTEAHAFAGLFDQHLSEEVDHAPDLAKDRQGALRELFDADLDARASWFVAKMLVLDDVEKLVLVHLVLEVGSHLFHQVANPALSPYGETDYFEIHEEADGEHEAMGLHLLDGLEPRTYERLYRVQAQGWAMLESLCARMAELAR